MRENIKIKTELTLKALHDNAKSGHNNCELERFKRYA